MPLLCLSRSSCLMRLTSTLRWRKKQDLKKMNHCLITCVGWGNKYLQVARGIESLNYEELCIHPNVDMLVGYKRQNFNIFDGMGDPHAHLRAYCDKLVGVGRNEKLRMKLFIRSLTGEALTWYTRQDPKTWGNSRIWSNTSWTASCSTPRSHLADLP